MSGISVVHQNERGVLFLFGCLKGTKEPGIYWVPPLIAKMIQVDMSLITITLPEQTVMTCDTVTINVTAVLSFSVIDPVASVVIVRDVLQATKQMSLAAMHTLLSQQKLAEVMDYQQQMNQELPVLITPQTLRWGVQVTMMDIKQIESPLMIPDVLTKNTTMKDGKQGICLSITDRTRNTWCERN